MKTLVSPGTVPMYLLDDGKGGVDYRVMYTKNQLQIIPPNEKKPDSSYIRGNKRRGVQKYVVEKILARKKIKNRIYYVVKWKGFDQTTEEPRSELIKDMPNMIKEFEASPK